MPPHTGPDPLPDRVGTYRLERALSTDGDGDVFRGHDERLRRPVVMRWLPGDSPGDRTAHRSALRRLARLSHPALVQVHDLVETEGGDWLVTELVEGRPLAPSLEAELEPRQALAVALHIAAGLAEAHEHGVTHGRLSIEKIRVTADGRPKILGLTTGSLHQEPQLDTDLEDLRHLLARLLRRGFENTGEAMPPACHDLLDELMDDTLDTSAAALAAKLRTTVEGPALHTPPPTPRPSPELWDETLVEGPKPIYVDTASTTMAPPPRRRWWVIAGVAVGALALLVTWLLASGSTLHLATPAPEIEQTDDPVAAERVQRAVVLALERAVRERGEIRVVPADEADEILTSRLSCSGPSCQIWMVRASQTDLRVLWNDVEELPVDDPLALERGLTLFVRRALAPIEDD